MTSEIGKHRTPRWPKWLLGVVLAVALSGCVTSQVRKITDSPQLEGSAGKTQRAPPVAGGTTALPAGADSPQRIDQIIAQNRGLTPATIASLRIRQGVLYLDQNQLNLAAAAFDSADATLLVTPRDQALKEVAPDLIWWFRTAPLPNIPGAEMKRAEAVMQSLEVQVAKRHDSPDVRDYLAEVRAWVGLKYFAALSSRSKQKAAMENTIDEYATIFTEADLAWLCAPASVSSSVPPEDERRRMRAEPVVKQAAKYASELTGANQPTFRDPVMQDLIAPKSPQPRCTG